MENKQDYLARLQVAVEHLHNCGAHYLRTEPVHEVFHGQTVWKGDVEVFGLTNHSKAKRAYAWSHREGKNDEEGGDSLSCWKSRRLNQRLRLFAFKLGKTPNRLANLSLALMFQS